MNERFYKQHIEYRNWGYDYYSNNQQHWKLYYRFQSIDLSATHGPLN